MKIFGLEIRRAVKQKALSSVDDQRGGWFKILDSFPGAWQQGYRIDRDTVLAYQAVYACVTLISQDIGKLRPKLVEQQKSGVWKEIQNSAYSPVLRKPNHYQNRIKFFEYWISSKLIHGNAYALKQRDVNGVVRALYLLDPTRVTPLVSDDGSVFYQLRSDNISKVAREVVVPAREMIHDLMVPLHHPLVGVSPIYACGLAATQGVKIQTNSTRLFENMSRPSGLLTAAGAISNDTATRLKTAWEENYSGENIGKVAVLGDGLKYEPMHITAVDAQLIEQLKWTAEQVCSCFHVPPYMIGVGTMPTYNNIEALNQQYYSQCLQSLIESMELCLDEGLEMVTPTQSYGVEMDLRGLLRMDTAARYKTIGEAIKAGWLAPNEGRVQEDYEPVKGGDSPLMQQQNWTLAQLAQRKAPEDSANVTPPPTQPEEDDEPSDEDIEAQEQTFAALLTKELAA